MTRGPPTLWSLSSLDGITSVNLKPGLRLASIYIITWFCSTIANIANHDPVSTYISQVIGNGPTSTELSMAKHIFDPGPTQGSRYISGQGNDMQQVFPINSYNLMHQT